MRWLATSLLFAALATTGCARAQGNWPSLARRAVETRAPDALSRPSPAPAESAALGRDVTSAEQRATAAGIALARAVDAARGAPAQDAAWAAAQTELTRLDAAEARLAALRSRLDSAAGEEARRAAGGVIDTPVIVALGRLIARIEIARAAAAAEVNAARIALAR